jgi:proline dehydrogenase
MELLNTAIATLLRTIPEGVLWRFARRYVAGKTLGEAMEVVRGLSARGLLATLDILGEHVGSVGEARADGDSYRAALRAIHRESLPCTISVKPTHMGLKIDRALCLEILTDLAAEAQRLGTFVRLDMEDSTCTDATLDLHRALRKDGHPVGVVLQAYLKRSQEDVRHLADEGANVRVCKGIYREPAAIAFRDRQVIRENFLRLLGVLMGAGCFVGIATHDPWVIQEARRLVNRLRLGRDAYEFQMLLGVRRDLGDRLLADGERVRIYVPYGEKWRAYCLRRFKENPQLVQNVLRALWAGGA